MELRVCKTCGVEKEFSEFPKNRSYKDGIRPHCISCRHTYENASYHKHKQKRPYNYISDKDSKLKRAFGIGLADYHRMFAEQGGCCAICKTNDTGKRKAFAIDHNHITGAVRGLLCSNCNTGIGNLRDDIGLLKDAIQYLEAHSQGKINA